MFRLGSPLMIGRHDAQTVVRGGADGPTMLLLSIIRHEPEAVERVVKRYHTLEEN